MIFEFQNLGAIREGKIELKDLTIVCGKNNLGKTYLTYSIFGFLDNWDDFVEAKLTPEQISELRTNGVVVLNLKSEIIDKAEVTFEKAVSGYLKQLPALLAANELLFSKTKIKLSCRIPSSILSHGFSSTLGTEEKRILSFEKPQGEEKLKISYLNEDNEISGYLPTHIINKQVTAAAWSQIFPKPFILSTERTGAISFKNELNLSKNKLMKFIHSVKDDEDISPKTILDNFFENDYASPIHKNVEATNRITSESTRESVLIKNFPQIVDALEAIVGGTFNVKSGELGFIPKKGVRLRMSESSSSVRSLALLSHYVLHLAKPGDLLIIDEPELNLHPSNQRALARFIALLINHNIKVFITTHSDYIIKEFNTLIMLNNKNDETISIAEKYNYSSNETLSPDKVAMYSIIQNTNSKTSKIHEIDIDNIYGIAASVFDEVINDMNNIQEELFYSLQQGIN